MVEILKFFFPRLVGPQLCCEHVSNEVWDEWNIPSDHCLRLETQNAFTTQLLTKLIYQMGLSCAQRLAAIFEESAAVARHVFTSALTNPDRGIYLFKSS